VWGRAVRQCTVIAVRLRRISELTWASHWRSRYYIGSTVATYPGPCDTSSRRKNVQAWPMITKRTSSVRWISRSDCDCAWGPSRRIIASINFVVSGGNNHDDAITRSPIDGGVQTSGTAANQTQVGHGFFTAWLFMLVRHPINTAYNPANCAWSIVAQDFHWNYTRPFSNSERRTSSSTYPFEKTVEYQEDQNMREIIHTQLWAQYISYIQCTY